jgi:quinol monooxygenase YgiN
MAASEGMSVLWVRTGAAMSDRRELTQALLTWVGTVRAEPGVASAHLSEDLETPGVYSLSVTWRRRRDLEAHLAGPDFSVLLGALDVLGHQTTLQVTASEEGTEDLASLLRRVRGRAPSAEHSSGPRRPAAAGPPTGIALSPASSEP